MFLIEQCIQDGKIQLPPILEEGTVEVEEKRRLWPWGGSSEDGGGKFKRGIE